MLFAVKQRFLLFSGLLTVLLMGTGGAFSISAHAQQRVAEPGTLAVREHINTCIKMDFDDKGWASVQLPHYNLNIPRYVDTFEKEAEIDITATQQEIVQLKTELATVEKEMAKYLKELGL